MKATKAQIQALLTELLSSVRETYTGDSEDPVFPCYTFESKAVAKVEAFLETL